MMQKINQKKITYSIFADQKYNYLYFFVNLVR